MLCPRCKEGKMAVIDTVKNPDDHEVYRRRCCKNCGYEQFTIEQKVVNNFNFLRAWSKYHR